jgi:hypothetical protein
MMKVNFLELNELYIIDSLFEEAGPDKLWFTRAESNSFCKSHTLGSIAGGRYNADHVGLERFISHEVTRENQSPSDNEEDHLAAQLARISAVNSMWARAQA